jgi:UDP-N-acetyl-D-galactosamine dehydrogenase
LVDANVLIMGLTFKENSRDLRNTGVADLVATFESFNCNVEVYDPWADKVEAQKEFNIKLVSQPENGKYDAIILSVAHDEFKKLSLKEIKAYGTSNHVLYDVKYLLKQSEVDGRL